MNHTETFTYPLQLPKSLKDKVEKISQGGTDINWFIAMAVVEKIAALETEMDETERFFAQKKKDADLNAFRAILCRSGGEAPRPGDERPPAVPK